jgi:cytoplasmic iron level regulating protein YaaA (DUF328/UPF0246 family)
MLSIISSAKSLDFKTPIPITNGTQPELHECSVQMLQFCKELSKDQLKKLMGISDNLAELNYQRFQNFESQPQKQAIFAYNGDVYDHIKKYDFTTKQVDFMQTHISIISGLYGLLRPLDYIQPYRLEMAVKLYGTAVSNFWNPIITNYINKILENHKYKYLINLASVEYSSVINRNILQHKIINIHFKEHKGGRLQTIGLNSKKARGMMANFIIKNLIDTPEQLQEFTQDNYQFSQCESSDSNWVFVR